MYVAKFDRHGVKWTVTLFEKHWSEEMLSHQINMLSRKKFFLVSSGHRWINKEICRKLFEQHKLEIING